MTNWDCTAEQIGSHVVAMPYPGRGHINPMMNLCHSLSARATDTLFTFVVTEEWLGFIGSDASKPVNVRFATIPNVLPSELVRGSNYKAFVEAVLYKMEEPFEQLLDRLDPPPKFIISDTFLPWALSVGKRRNIPVASFCPHGASVFSIFYHFDLIVKNHHFPVDLSEKGNQCIDYIPGTSSMTVADLPHASFGHPGTAADHLDSSEHRRENLPLVVEIINIALKAQCLLFATIYELEPKAIDTLRSKLPLPIYTIGPNIPYFRLEQNPETNDLSYLQWLDSKPAGTVLYVSLGSFLQVSGAQMAEIAGGLRDSGVAYLWVVRGDTSHLDNARGGNTTGLVVPWCDQLRVLCHSSVGGFWTHCEWNSVMESVFAGVPMVTFPITIDQIPNRKLVVKDWKIGCGVKEDVGTGRSVKREEIAELVQRFMDVKSTTRTEMTSRAKERQEVSRQAIKKGGSSDTDLDALIMKIL